MAERRMFAKTIVESDAFLDMPLSTQALYFHLGMHADDDGFVGSPRRISRNIGSSEDDLKILIAKKFILPFDSGIVVLKHWKINNYIQKDRYKPTPYLEERSALFLKENQTYTLTEPAVPETETPSNSNENAECIQDVYTMDTDCTRRLGKDRDRVRIGQYSNANERMNINNNARACTRERAGAREDVADEYADAEARLRARETVERAKPIIDANDPKWMEDHADQMERIFGPGWREEREKRLDALQKTVRHPEWV